MEELFLNFGERCRIEDIENFAAVFSTAKRSGGDMDKIIQTSARMLGDKIDVKKEIEATLAAKKAEQMIMSMMPAGIILYLQLSTVRELVRRLRHDGMPWHIPAVLLDGTQDRGYRGMMRRNERKEKRCGSILYFLC